MAPPLRVLLSTADYPPYMDGGVAVAAEQTADALGRTGVQATLLYALPKGAVPLERPNHVGVPTRAYGRPSLRYFAYARASSRIRRRLLADADVYHCLASVHGDMGDGLEHARHSVTTIHNTMAMVERNLDGIQGSGPLRRRAFYRLLKRIERRVCALSDVLVAPSAATADDVVASYGVPRSKIRIIHQGVDPSRAPPAAQAKRVADGRPLLLSVGRMVPRKGMETLVDAWSHFAPRHPDYRLVMVGRGEAAYETALRTHVQELGQASRVEILPHVSNADLARLYTDARLFVFASRVEGFGMAPAEALSTGTPVVAVDIPGLRDVVLKGHGSVPLPTHEPGAMADAWSAALADPARYRDLSEEAFRHARKFTWQETAQRLTDVYREIVGVPAGATP